jgi:hypothetical protein
MRNVGVGLIVLVYAVLLFTSSSAPVAMSDKGIVATRTHAGIDPMMGAITVAGIALAVIPVRRGEKWAQLTTLVTLIIVLVTRYATSGQRLVVLDLNQHDRSLIIASVLAIVGPALTNPSRGIRPSRGVE